VLLDVGCEIRPCFFVHKIHSKIELIMGFKTLISRLAFV